MAKTTKPKKPKKPAGKPKKPAAKPRKSPKRQSEIPGAERRSVPELDIEVSEFLDAEEERVSAKIRADTAKTGALALMKKLGILSYTFVDGELPYTVKRDPREDGISIRQKKGAKEAAA